MKISSQLANNFDYCSAESEYFLIKNSLLCVLSGREKKSIFRNPDQSYASVVFHSEKTTVRSNYWI